MKRCALALALALCLVLAQVQPALADYTTADGHTVTWAGGDNIKVFDSSGNLVYSGSGQQVGERLAWDGTYNQNQYASSPTQVGQQVTEDWLDSHPATTLGLGGVTKPSSLSGGSSGGSSVSAYQGAGTTNPYSSIAGLENTVYSGVQEISVVLPDGTTVVGGMNVYVQERAYGPDDPRSPGYGAVPAESQIGQLLAQAGFQVKDGWVLTDINTPATVQTSWTPGTTVGPNQYLVGYGSYNPNPPAGWEEVGGSLTVVLPSMPSSQPQPQQSSSGGGSSYVPPDVRALMAYPELPVAKVGTMVPLVAAVTGTCRQVNAFAGWGGSAVLVPGADGKLRGVLQVPVNVRPGVYPLVFEAVIGQAGYADRRFTVSTVLTVQAQGGGDTTPVPPAADEEPDWWTPPQYQGR
ncbi:MAG: hypothetical protein ACPLPR_01295 [Bacillota bacterium]